MNYVMNVIISGCSTLILGAKIFLKMSHLNVFSQHLKRIISSQLAFQLHASLQKESI